MVKTITNGKLVPLYRALSEFARSRAEVPVSVGFAVVQDITAMEPHVKDWGAVRDRILEECGARDGTLTGADEGWPDFTRKLSELDAITVDVEIRTIDPEDLKGINIPMSQMFALAYISEGSEG